MGKRCELELAFPLIDCGVWLLFLNNKLDEGLKQTPPRNTTLHFNVDVLALPCVLILLAQKDYAPRQEWGNTPRFVYNISGMGTQPQVTLWPIRVHIINKFRMSIVVNLA